MYVFSPFFLDLIINCFVTIFVDFTFVVGLYYFLGVLFIVFFLFRRICVVSSITIPRVGIVVLFKE